MSEKFILRFSPSETERPITSVSISADEKYGEVISYSALCLSEQLTKKLEELSDKVVLDNWGPMGEGNSLVRITTSWATPPEAVEYLISLL